MRLILVAFLTLVSVAGPASAGAESPLWKMVGDWQIRVDDTLGHGCFALAAYSEGSMFRVGFDMDSRQAYVIIGNDRWKSIEMGKAYDLVFQFDDASRWKGKATGVSFRSGGHPYLATPIDNPEFLSQFARRNGMSIKYKSHEIARLSLKGSRRALTEMIACQHAVSDALAQKGRSRDPFLGGPHRPASDPLL